VICFQEFNAIPERVVDIGALVAIEGLVLDDLDVRCSEPADHRVQIRDQQGRMRLPRPSEVLVHAEMNLQQGTLEPTTTPNGEVRRLWTTARFAMRSDPADSKRSKVSELARVSRLGPAPEARFIRGETCRGACRS